MEKRLSNQVYKYDNTLKTISSVTPYINKSIIDLGECQGKIY